MYFWFLILILERGVSVNWDYLCVHLTSVVDALFTIMWIQIQGAKPM
jgi:hypothetical protein